MVFAEALGEHEAKDSLPLRPYAPSGAIFERTLRRAGMDRQQIAVSNCVRCKPPMNRLEHADYEFAALNHCDRTYTAREILEYKPKVILALGNVPLRHFTGYAGKKQTVSHVRGFVLEGTRYPGIPVISSLHPAYLARKKANLLGVLRTDLMRARELASNGGKFQRPVKSYQAFPPIDAARRWLEEARKLPDELITFDIETVESLAGIDESELRALPDGRVEWTKIKEEFQDIPEDRLEPDDEPVASVEITNTRITQVQFSIRPFEAIILPFVGDYIQVARDIMALPNPKGSWNGRLFDLAIMRQAGVVCEGIHLDFMDAQHHLQADLPKGLQFVTSLYLPYCEPWKHLSDADPGRYGGDDVSYLREFGPRILAQLKSQGLWYGYDRQVRALGIVLDNATRRGIPVDNQQRLALDAEVEVAQAGVGAEIQSRVPDTLRNCEPKGGYKNPTIALKKMKEVGCGLKTGEKWGVRDFGSGETVHAGPDEIAGMLAGGGSVAEDSLGASVVRARELLAGGGKWCRLLPFLPNSTKQILKWIKSRREEDVRSRIEGYRAQPRYAAQPEPVLRAMAERTSLWKVPKTLREDKETTAKVELERLSKRTGDDFLLRIIEHREYGKIRSTYVKGWVPAADGCVHSVFKFAPATGQISSSGPNCQNSPAPKGPEGSRQRRLAEAFRRMIVAKPGHKIVTFDYKAFHVLTTGFEAKAPTWMRLARRDMHSFTTGMFIGEPWETWLDLPDEELDEVLRRIKGQKTPRYQELKTNFIRNKKAKPAGLAIGFGAQERKIYDLNQESFANVGEVKKFFSLLKTLDPRVFKWQGEVRLECHEVNKGFLKTSFEYMRWFHDVYRWDSRRGTMVPGEDHEAVVAYRPSNDAFGIKKDVELWLGDNGLDERYGFANDIHDELWFHCPDQFVEECLHTVRTKMMEPNPRLVDPILAPVGLWCEVEASVGPNWLDMEEIKFSKDLIKQILAKEEQARALVGTA